MLRINNIKIRKDLTKYEIFEIAIKKSHVKKDDVIDWKIAKKSIDARKKEDVHYNYSVDIAVKDEKKYRKLEKVKISEIPSISIKNTLTTRPIIVGAGPSRPFCCPYFSSK